MHSTSKELFSRGRKYRHTKLRLAFTDRRGVRVIDEGKSAVVFIVLLSIEESSRPSTEEVDREDAEEFMPVVDVEQEEQRRTQLLVIERIGI